MEIVKGAGIGLLCGLGWGALARVWMHFLTADPEFTWSGTSAILVVAAMTGAALGALHAARVGARSRWWRLLALPTLLLFASPGAVLLPTYVVGGFSLSGRGPTWLRVLLGAAVLGWTGWGIGAFVLGEDPPGLVVPVAGWLAVSGTMALAGSELFRRWPSRSRITLETRSVPAQA